MLLSRWTQDAGSQRQKYDLEMLTKRINKETKQKRRKRSKYKHRKTQTIQDHDINNTN